MNNDVKEYSFTIEGMSCASCALAIEQELSAIDGVEFYSVNYALEKTSFQLTDDRILSDVITQVNKLGYTLVETKLAESYSDDNFEDNFWKFLISITLSILLFAFAMAKY